MNLSDYLELYLYGSLVSYILEYVRVVLFLNEEALAFYDNDPKNKLLTLLFSWIGAVLSLLYIITHLFSLPKKADIKRKSETYKDTVQFFYRR